MRIRKTLAVATLLAAGVFVVADTPRYRSANPTDAVPTQELVQGPDRHDFPCKVELESPILTYQQRYLVGVGITLDRRELMKNGASRDLHYVVKVADEAGKWFAGQSYEHVTVSRSRRATESYAEILVRPGSYTVVTIVYDSVHQQANVQRVHLKVGALKNDPLPLVDRNINAAEFPLDPPRLHFQSPAEGRWYFYAARFRPGYVTGSWAFTDDPLHLPVRNAMPAVIDVVVNFSPGSSFGSSVPAYEWNANLMLQVASVLSGLEAGEGCARLSAVDVVQQSVLLDRRETKKLDWRSLRELVLKTNYAEVDVQTLSKATQGAIFFRDFLAQLNTDSSPCGLEPGHYLHVMIVASTGLVFPRGSPIPPLQPENSTKTLFYYVRPLVRPSDLWDQIGGILRLEKPVILEVRGGAEFRRGLAHIISGIEQQSHTTGPASETLQQSQLPPAAP